MDGKGYDLLVQIFTYFFLFDALKKKPCQVLKFQGLKLLYLLKATKEMFVLVVKKPFKVLQFETCWMILAAKQKLFAIRTKVLVS